MPQKNQPPRVDWDAFYTRVEQVVRAIPKGQTLSYAQIALRAGRPGGARSAARAMRFCSKGTPWWRVTRSDRSFAPQVAEEQARRLRLEGHRFKGSRLARPTQA